MTTETLFTSESVSDGHPDKIADQISDAILDNLLTQDSHSRVACETLVKTGMVIIAGEITTKGFVDTDQLGREVIKNIGYTDPDFGFDHTSCSIISAIGKQSADIAQGVDNHIEQGAGDQGLMFGYATNETDVFMPAPITYAHRLMRKHKALRNEGKLPWLRPDAKSQLTFRYQNSKPVGIETVLISTQHAPDVSQDTIREGVIEEIIKPVLQNTGWLDDNTRYLVNPTGRFVVGGPLGDCGLTGRKIIVDTYGGMARHGGGAFSGKDPSKVDRSAAYAARYVAKNIVAAGLAERCEVQLSYAIGVAQPVSIAVDTFGTGHVSDALISNTITQYFDLTPRGMISMLDLLTPIYQITAAFGHFGRADQNFTWEKTDKAEALAGHFDKVVSLEETVS